MTKKLKGKVEDDEEEEEEDTSDKKDEKQNGFSFDFVLDCHCCDCSAFFDQPHHRCCFFQYWSDLSRYTNAITKGCSCSLNRSEGLLNFL